MMRENKIPLQNKLPTQNLNLDDSSQTKPKNHYSKVVLGTGSKD